MSNENQGQAYLKVVAGIIEKEMLLEPSNPLSTDPNDHRVFIGNQSFVIPQYDYMFIIISESPGKVISAVSRFDDSGPSPTEVQEIIMQREIEIDVMSRTTKNGYTEARERKEEVLMAIASVYSQQQQEANGFRIFSFPTSFVDVTENEGAGRLIRYHASLMAHVRYSKQKAVDYFGTFDYNTVTN
jgi:hypothetical protein